MEEEEEEEVEEEEEEKKSAERNWAGRIIERPLGSD